MATRLVDNARGPLVSVIIPFYKQEAYVAEAIASVKAQTYRHYEVIVVDDGSPVSAASVCGDNPDITLIRTENRGVSAARNTGAARSRGEYLLFFDADDILMPEAVETHLRAFAFSPNAALSFGAIRYVDHLGRETRAAHICRPRRDYFLMLLESNPNGNPGANLLRRSAFLEVGGFDESLRMAEDYDLFLKLARHAPFVRLTECVLAYRLHSSNISHRKDSMLEATLLVLDRFGASLSKGEMRRMRHGKQRWRHAFQPRTGFLYHLGSLYYSVRAMLTTSLRFEPRPRF